VLKELLKAGGAGLGSLSREQLRKILKCKSLPYQGVNDVLVAQVKDAIVKGVVSHVPMKKAPPVWKKAVKKAIVKGVKCKNTKCFNDRATHGQGSRGGFCGRRCARYDQ
jgi:hypothetical protein